MPLHYVKIGSTVLAIAIVTYIFRPDVERSETVSTKPGHHAASTQATANTQSKTAYSRSAEHKRAQKSSQQIAPETTLHEKQTANRSGPPSKMYGGL